jgi:dolichol-phosphate mannosyltransferase
MISVVIPAYNETGNISVIAGKIKEQLREEGPYELLFVDDGSTDGTLQEIKAAINEDPCVKYISLSRNFGHQNALKAGLDYATGNCVICMDADMQHPPHVLPKLIKYWKEGYDVVYTVRKDNESVSRFKRATSKTFYKLMNLLCDVEIPMGSADFRLMDKKVVDEIRQFRENWIFMRGLVSWLGFRQIGVEYEVEPRHVGSSKYSFSKMLAFAVQGATSFSILPLRLSMVVGFIFSMVSFLYGVYALYVKIFTGVALKGWTSILMSILFLGGIQLLSLGIIGEYVGKMFIETKGRPSYVIREKRV